MQKLLFIRGYNTDTTTTDDHYIYLKQNLSKKYKVTYFNYAVTDDIQMVYKQLCGLIKKKKWDVLIGHSLGGGLLTKYIRNNDVSAHKRVILLMPFIGTRTAHTLASLIPPLHSISLPKALLIPSVFLYEGASVLEDSWDLIPVHQFYDTYADPQVSSNDFSFINDASNIYMFYASQEMFNTIDEIYLARISPTKLKRVDGLHEVFYSPDTKNAKSFFSKINKLLDDV